MYDYDYASQYNFLQETKLRLQKHATVLWTNDFI